MTESDLIRLHAHGINRFVCFRHCFMIGEYFAPGGMVTLLEIRREQFIIKALVTSDATNEVLHCPIKGFCYTFKPVTP